MGGGIGGMEEEERKGGRGGKEEEKRIERLKEKTTVDFSRVTRNKAGGQVGR